MEFEKLKQHWSNSLALVGFGFEQETRSMIHLFGNGVLVTFKDTVWLVSCLDFFDEQTSDHPFKVVIEGEEVSHTVLLHHQFIKQHGIRFEHHNMAMIPLSKVSDTQPWTQGIPKLFDWQSPMHPISPEDDWLFITRPVSRIKPAAAFNPSSLQQVASHHAEYLEARRLLKSEESRTLRDVHMLRPTTSGFSLGSQSTQQQIDELQYYLSGYLGGIVLTLNKNGTAQPVGLIIGTGVTALQDTEDDSTIHSGLLLFNKLSTTLTASDSMAGKD